MGGSPLFVVAAGAPFSHLWEKVALAKQGSDEGPWEWFNQAATSLIRHAPHDTFSRKREKDAPLLSRVLFHPIPLAASAIVEQAGRHHSFTVRSGPARFLPTISSASRSTAA